MIYLSLVVSYCLLKINLSTYVFSSGKEKLQPRDCRHFTCYRFRFFWILYNFVGRPSTGTKIYHRREGQDRSWQGSCLDSSLGTRINAYENLSKRRGRVSIRRLVVKLNLSRGIIFIYYCTFVHTLPSKILKTYLLIHD